VDVEGTIQFILESQAKAEAHMGAMDARLDSITKLVKQGMRLLVKFQGEATSFQSETTSKFNALAASQLRTDVKFAELAEAQKVTELKLQLLFDTLRKNRNGDQH
jgi:hypothetical protein